MSATGGNSRLLCIWWPTPSTGTPRALRSATSVEEAGPLVRDRGVVVVDEQDGVRRDLARHAERGVDEVLPGDVEPGALAHAVGLALVDHLVDDVPGVDLVRRSGRRRCARGCPGAGGAGRGWRAWATSWSPVSGIREDPGRRLAVPGQRVTAHEHAVGLRERHLLVGVREREVALLGLGRVPLHVVLGREAVEVLLQQVAVHARDGRAAAPPPRSGRSRPGSARQRAGRARWSGAGRRSPGRRRCRTTASELADST